MAEQRADLRAIRSHASIVAAVSGFVVAAMSRLAVASMESRIGSHAILLSSEFHGAKVSMAIACSGFMGTVILTLLVLLPTGGWKFDDSPRLMLENLAQKGIEFDADKLYMKLALAKEKRFKENEILMQKVQTKFFFACTFIPVQAFGWATFWWIG